MRGYRGRRSADEESHLLTHQRPGEAHVVEIILTIEVRRLGQARVMGIKLVLEENLFVQISYQRLTQRD